MAPEPALAGSRGRHGFGVLSEGALVAFLGLGAAVSHAPPSPLDAVVHDAVYDHALGVAAALTRAGRLPAYVAVCSIALAFGLIRRAWLGRAVLSIVVLIASDVASNVFKDFFARPRPPHQAIFTETSYAYGSGHATLALAFYGGWALLAWRSSLPAPRRRAIVFAASVWIVAISWSRLALGAHWFTDIVGGLLLGTVALSVQAMLDPFR
jgi:undecaprenyl-diphosphatase